MARRVAWKTIPLLGKKKLSTIFLCEQLCLVQTDNKLSTVAAVYWITDSLHKKIYRSFDTNHLYMINWLRSIKQKLQVSVFPEKSTAFLSETSSHNAWWKKRFGVRSPLHIYESREQNWECWRYVLVFYVLAWYYSKTFKLFPRENHRLQTFCCQKWASV